MEFKNASRFADKRDVMVYAWRSPRNVHRSVMIGVNPPANFVWKVETTDEQMRRYAALCSKDAS